MPSRSPKKSRLRWSRVLLVAALVTGILAVWGYNLISSRLSAEFLAGQIGQALGMDVTLASYELRWMGGIEVKQLQAQDGGREVLSVERAQASFALLSLLRGTPDFKELRVERPVLHIDRGILNKLSTLSEGPGSDDFSVEFRQAEIYYQTSSGQTLSATELDGSYHSALPARLELNSPAGRLSMQLEETLRMELQDVELAWLAAVAGYHFPLEGTLSGRLEVTEQAPTRVAGQLVVSLPEMDIPLELAAQVSETVGLTARLQTRQLEIPWLGALQDTALTVSWDGETLNVDDLTTQWREHELTGSGFLRATGEMEWRLAGGSGAELRLQGEEFQPQSITLKWEDQEVLAAQAGEPGELLLTYLDGARLARLADLPGPIEGLVTTGSLRLGEEALSAELSSEGGRLAGIEVKELSFQIEAGEAVRWEGSVEIAGQELPVHGSYEDGKTSVTSSAKQLPLSLLGAVYAPFQGAVGQADVNLDASWPGGNGQLEFSLSDSEVAGFSLPALEGELELKDKLLVVKKLSTTDLSPPLEVTGQVELPDGKLEMRAELKDHPLEIVAGLVGQKVPVAGTISGPVKLTGTASEPSISFDGSLKEAAVRGVALGKVKVSISGPVAHPTVSFEAGPIDLKSLHPRLAGEGRVSGRPEGSQLQLAVDFPKASLDGHSLGPLKGDLSSPEVNFKGTLHKLSLDGKLLGDIPVEAVVAPEKKGYLTILRLSGLKVASLAPNPDLGGTLSARLVFPPEGEARLQAELSKATYKKRAVPNLTAELEPLKKPMTISRLVLAGDPPLTGSGSYDRDTGALQLDFPWKGHDLKQLDWLGYPVGGKLTGNLSLTRGQGPLKIDFKGKGQNLVYADTVLGSPSSGRLTVALSEPATFEVNLAGLPASQVGFLTARYPGIQGQSTLNVRSAPQGIGLSFSLSDASLPDGRAFPSLSANLRWVDPVLKITSLTVGTQPPLVVSGQVDTDQAQLAVAGELAGQELQHLMVLGAGQPPGDLSANLFGDLRLEGPQSQPVLTLKGPVENLIFRRYQLGSGNLNVTVGQNLAGELRLDQPYQASLRDFAPEQMDRFPGLDRVLSGTLNVKVLGATFSGTPAEPVVTPQLGRLPLVPAVVDRDREGVIRLPGLGDRRVKIRF